VNAAQKEEVFAENLGRVLRDITSEMMRLRDERKAIQARLEEIRTTFSVLTSERDHLRIDLAQAQGDIDQASRKLQTQRAEIQRLTAQNRELQQLRRNNQAPEIDWLLLGLGPVENVAHAGVPKDESVTAVNKELCDEKDRLRRDLEHAREVISDIGQSYRKELFHLQASLRKAWAERDQAKRDLATCAAAGPWRDAPEGDGEYLTELVDGRMLTDTWLGGKWVDARRTRPPIRCAKIQNPEVAK